MKIEGSHHYPYARDRVFAALLDPAVLAGTLPGCEELVQTGDLEYSGKLAMKVGPVQGVFQGKVRLFDVVAPLSYRLELEGNGAPGFVHGDGIIRLEQANGGTELFYDIDAKVGGKIASIGQRLIESSAKVITRQGLAGLEAQLAHRHALEKETAENREDSEVAGERSRDATPASATAPIPAERASSTAPATATTAKPPAPRSQSEFAREFAKGMAREMAPGSSSWAWGVGALLLMAAIVAILLRTCGS